MPYGDCSLSKKLDDGGHRPLNSAVPTTSMAVVKTRVLRFSRLRIRERGNAKLPRYRRHALTMTRREAETCRASWTFFLPYRPNGCWDSMANPNYLALSPRRFGGHGALTRENEKRRGKTVQALYRLFVFPRRSYRRSFNFRFARRKNHFPGLSKFQIFMRRPKGYTTPLATAPT